MTHKVKFSIIIPVYNVRRDIGTCLKSILAQTYQNYEVLCLDDGSTDHSYRVILEYAKKDKRIQCFRHTNRGVSYTRNAGIQKAVGEYIWFVDADDWVEPNALEILAKELRKQKSDIVVFGAKVFVSKSYHEDDTYLDDAFLYFKKNLATRKIDYVHNSTAALLYETGSYPLIWNKIYKRSLIISNGVQYEERLKLGEDEAFLFHIFPLADHISYIPDCLYHYQRNRPQSATDRIVRNEYKRAEQNFQMAKIVAGYWDDLGLFPEYTYQYLERYTSLLYSNALAIKTESSNYKDYIARVDQFFAKKFDMYKEFSLNALTQSKVWGWREFRLGAKILYLPNKIKVLKEYGKCFGLFKTLQRMIPNLKISIVNWMLKRQFSTIFYYFYFYIWAGYKNYLDLKKKWGRGCVFLSCAALGTGDLYQVSLMLPQWLKENHIKQFCMLIVGNSEMKLAEEMFPKLYRGHIQKIDMRTHERLRKLRNFVGKDNIDFHYLCHFDNLSDYMQITWRIQGKYGWNMLKFYKHKGLNLMGRVNLQLPNLECREEDIAGIFEHMKLKKGKTVLLSPFATCADEISERFWAGLAKLLAGKGYSVCTNCSKQEEAVKGTKSIFLPYSQIIAFLDMAGVFIGIRSGLADIISSSKCKKIIIYPQQSSFWPEGAAIDYLGLNAMGLTTDAKEFEAGSAAWKEIYQYCKKYL